MPDKPPRGHPANSGWDNEGGWQVRCVRESREGELDVQGALGPLLNDGGIVRRSQPWVALMRLLAFTLG